MHPVTLLLKGARTLIAQRDHPTVSILTGNPGMGSGGMGRCADRALHQHLIGGGKFPRDAAILGAWICGRAAEIAVFCGDDSTESLSASSVIDHLGSLRLLETAIFSRLRSFSAPHTSPACSACFTFGKMATILPFGSITKVVRSVPLYFLPYIDFSTQTP